MQSFPQPVLLTRPAQPTLPIALICVGIALAAGNIALYPIVSELEKVGFVFVAVWYGALIGQAALVAIWLAVGNAKELVRLATAGIAYGAGAMTLLAGFFFWEGPNGMQSANWSELASPFLIFPLGIIAAAFPLWLLRLFAGWCIHHRQAPPNSRSIRQYSIRSLILLTTLVALMLGLGQQVARLENKGPLESWMPMGVVFLAAMIWSGATLIPAVVLLTRFPALAGLGLIAPSIAYFAAASLLVSLNIAFGGKPPTNQELWGIYGIASCPFLGYLVALFLPLAILRWAGYRLVP